MRSTWLACILALGWSSWMRAQTPIIFRDALALTQRYNQQLHAADAQVDRSRATRAAAQGLYFPSVSASGWYAHLNDHLFVDVNGQQAVVLRNDPYKVSLNSRWTVFAGGAILAANREAQAGVAVAERERQQTRQGVTTELVERHFKLGLAAVVLGVRRQALETFCRHLEDAHRLKTAGQIARTDGLRAEVAHAEADREFKKAARDVDLATVALRSTLGNEIDALPTTPLALITRLEPLTTFAAAADSGNATIGRLAALREQAHRGVRAARAELFPSISVLGTYELLQGRLNTTTDPQWIVGVGARWELFDGFTRVNRIRAARELEAAVGSGHARARDEVATLVKQRYNEYEAAREQYQALETTVALARESLRSEQRAYEAAVGTSLNVIDAELSLSRAQVDRLTALYDLNVAVARLLEASGRSDRFLEYLDRATPAEEPR